MFGIQNTEEEIQKKLSSIQESRKDSEQLTMRSRSGAEYKNHTNQSAQKSVIVKNT